MLCKDTIAIQSAFKEFFNEKGNQVERKAFKEFKEILQFKNIELASEQIEDIFTAVTGESATYILQDAYNDEEMQVAKILFNRFMDNLSNKPQSASELMGAQWETEYKFGAYTNCLNYYMHDARLCVVEYINRKFRQFLNQLAEANLIKRSKVTNCGRVVMYLYSI